MFVPAELMLAQYFSNAAGSVAYQQQKNEGDVTVHQNPTMTMEQPSCRGV
jgi:hypothetical protein